MNNSSVDQHIGEWRTVVNDILREFLFEVLTEPGQPRLRRVQHIARNWATIREYEKMNFLKDLSNDLCFRFGVGEVRLFSCKTWDSYRSAVGGEPDSAESAGSYRAVVNDELNPTIVLALKNFISLHDQPLFFAIIHTLGHEHGHYFIDIYKRHFLALRNGDSEAAKVSGYFLDKQGVVQNLTSYLSEYDLAEQADDRFKTKDELMDELAKASQDGDVGRRRPLRTQYSLIPDEHAAEVMQDVLHRAVLAMTWWPVDIDDKTAIANEMLRQSRKVISKMMAMAEQQNLVLNKIEFEEVLSLEEFRTVDEFLNRQDWLAGKFMAFWYEWKRTLNTPDGDTFLTHIDDFEYSLLLNPFHELMGLKWFVGALGQIIAKDMST
jgi:hypothetical protein